MAVREGLGAPAIHASASRAPRCPKPPDRGAFWLFLLRSRSTITSSDILRGDFRYGCSVMFATVGPLTITAVALPKSTLPFH